MAEDPLISIGEASQTLGVSQATLRQWTDEGKIKSFITPGGHRRYSKVELKKLIDLHPKVLGIRDLVTGLEETDERLRQIGQEILKSISRYCELNDDGKKQLANLGRSLLSLIIKYIAEPSHREETMRLVHEVGHDLGEILVKLGLPLTDSVEAFILHRDPLMNAVTQLIRKREAFTGRVAEAIPMVNHVMDKALVTLVVAHQHYPNVIKSRIEEDRAR